MLAERNERFLHSTQQTFGQGAILAVRTLAINARLLRRYSFTCGCNVPVRSEQFEFVLSSHAILLTDTAPFRNGEG